MNTRQRYILFFIAALLVMASSISITYYSSQSSEINKLQEESQKRAELLAKEIDTEISRLSYLPALIEMNEKVFSLLDKPDNLEIRQQVNLYLQQISDIAGTETIYIVDAKGIGIAAADWNRYSSPIGVSYTFRPYFIDGINKGSGSFFGVGITSHRSGYFSSRLIHRAPHPKGVTIIKLGAVVDKHIC